MCVCVHVCMFHSGSSPVCSVPSFSCAGPVQESWVCARVYMVWHGLAQSMGCGTCTTGWGLCSPRVSMCVVRVREVPVRRGLKECVLWVLVSFLCVGDRLLPKNASLHTVVLSDLNLEYEHLKLAVKYLVCCMNLTSLDLVSACVPSCVNARTIGANTRTLSQAPGPHAYTHTRAHKHKGLLPFPLTKHTRILAPARMFVYWETCPFFVRHPSL